MQAVHFAPPGPLSNERPERSREQTPSSTGVVGEGVEASRPAGFFAGVVVVGVGDVPSAGVSVPSSTGAGSSALVSVFGLHAAKRRAPPATARDRDTSAFIDM